MGLLEDKAVLVDGGSQGNARADLSDPVQELDSAVRANARGHDVRLEPHGVKGSIGVGPGDELPPCTVTDAVEASRIADACTLSLHEHRPVRLEEVRK